MIRMLPSRKNLWSRNDGVPDPKFFFPFPHNRG